MFKILFIIIATMYFPLLPKNLEPSLIALHNNLSSIVIPPVTEWLKHNKGIYKIGPYGHITNCFDIERNSGSNFIPYNTYTVYTKPLNAIKSQPLSGIKLNLPFGKNYHATACTCMHNDKNTVFLYANSHNISFTEQKNTPLYFMLCKTHK